MQPDRLSVNGLSIDPLSVNSLAVHSVVHSAVQPTGHTPVPRTSLPLRFGANTLALLLSSQALGADDAMPIDQKVDILTQELARLRDQLVVPEQDALKSVYGLGPAASKVYGTTRGVSLGGYGEAYYRALVKDKVEGEDYNSSDFYRFVLYTGYKFSDRILFNSELEIEHATTSNNWASKAGSVSVELAYLDFLLTPALNVRAGMVLMPMGLVNEIHEPAFFRGNVRPEVERQVIPTTWRENGAGIFGEPIPGLEYRAYIVTGLNASKFSDSGIRDGRQKGNQVLAESLAGVARLDYDYKARVKLGGSVYFGDSGQAQVFEVPLLDADGNPLLDAEGAPQTSSVQPTVPTLVYEGHAQLRHRGLEVRAVYVGGSIGDAEVLSQALGKTVPSGFFGAYGEVSADVFALLGVAPGQALIPWLRAETYNLHAQVPTGFTASASKDVQILAAGIDYKPHPSVVVKLDYRDYSNAAETEEADELTLGIGYVF